MRTIIITIVLMLGSIISFASDRKMGINLSVSPITDTVDNIEGRPVSPKVSTSKHPRRNVRPVSDEPILKIVTTTRPGELEELLGEEMLSIDSLAVNGPLNEDDFTTMYHATLYGRLEVLNLSGAEIEGDCIPERSFWRQEQFVFEDGWLIKIYLVQLKSVTLPEGIVKIGNGAFGFNSFLEEINFPSSLIDIDDSAFTNCDNLPFEQVTLPEGLENIGQNAFRECHLLKGDLVLPSTLKSIGFAAFYNSLITSVVLPEGLECIDSYAFYTCDIQGELVIPSQLAHAFKGECHFGQNYRLERVVLPDGMEVIPDAILTNCHQLLSVSLPESVKRIGKDAFMYSHNLKEINLPEGLDSIDTSSFEMCMGLANLILPSTLEWIGGNALSYCSGLKAIYSKSIIPPHCGTVGQNASGVFNGLATTIPIYVPVGAAAAYNAAPQWNRFTNIIEIEEFPQSGLDTIEEEPEGLTDDGVTIYDLHGRPVSKPVTGQIYLRKGEKFVYR